MQITQNDTIQTIIDNHPELIPVFEKNGLGP